MSSDRYSHAQPPISACIVFMYSVQLAHRISFNATMVSALHHQSTVIPEWTVLMDLMNVDVVSTIYYKFVSCIGDVSAAA